VKPHTWRVSMTVGVIVSLLLGLAAVGLGVENLRKINNLNTTVANLKTTTAVAAVEMATPASGAVVAGSVTLDAVPAGGNPTSVVFVADGGTAQNAQIATAKLSIAGWTATWGSKSLPNGTYEIAAVAYNGSGKTSTSPGVSVTVKNP
jgi:hypothetical protein